MAAQRLFPAQWRHLVSAVQGVEAQPARRLLRLRDLSGSNTLEITRESLAQMPGAGRNSIALVANAMRLAGTIRDNRGHHEMADVEALTENSCACYEAVKAASEGLSPPS
jgi:hypothetical protein